MNEFELLGRLVKIEERLAALEKGGGAKGQTKAMILPAKDADLDGEYGNPEIKYGLKANIWPQQPDPHIGYRFSDCESEYLEVFAGYLERWAGALRKDGDDKKAGYKERDAARALGHADRNRGKTFAELIAKKKTAESAEFTDDGGDSIPF